MAWLLSWAEVSMTEHLIAASIKGILVLITAAALCVALILTMVPLLSLLGPLGYAALGFGVGEAVSVGVTLATATPGRTKCAVRIA